MNNLVPNWKYLNQVEGEERKRSSHVLMDNDHEVTELTWENGQLAKHGLSGLLPNKPTWNRSSDTLESVVHQATSSHNNNNPEMSLPYHPNQFNPANTSSTFSFSFEKSIENPKFRDTESRIAEKRMRLEPDQSRENPESSFQEGLESGYVGGSAAFSRENDFTTMMTWTSLEGDPPNLKAKTKDDDSACHCGSENMDEEEQRRTKGETSRANSTRRNRAAANHNQSERRRRDRINQKMKALQRLVPNASKNDKASMLDEVIAYLKQLQAQVKMMNMRTVPQMLPAFAMQQQMQMALLARMGMGVGLGMSPTGNTAAQTLPQIISQAQIASANSPFFSPPFVMPTLIPNSNATAINNSASFNNPYSSFFAQPMNMDLYNKMAAIYQQQMNQTNQPTRNPLPHNNVQEG